VNRLQNAIAMLVLEMLAKDWASLEEIDRPLKPTLGIRLPIAGVLQTYDFTGLDLVHDLMKGPGMTHPLFGEMRPSIRFEPGRREPLWLSITQGVTQKGSGRTQKGSGRNYQP
jgi:hypothetical protein